MEAFNRQKLVSPMGHTPKLQFKCEKCAKTDHRIVFGVPFLVGFDFKDRSGKRVRYSKAQTCCRQPARNSTEKDYVELIGA